MIKIVGGNNVYYNFNNDFFYIKDVNECRCFVFVEVDRVFFGWYYIRVIFVVGVGFFIDL